MECGDRGSKESQLLEAEERCGRQRGLQDMGVFGGTKRVQIQEEKHPEEGSALGNPRRGVWHNVRHGRITVSSRGESCGASGL